MPVSVEEIKKNNATEKSSSSDKKSNERIQVRTDELIIGRTIEFPIYDAQGLLLLAEGAQISSRFKELLRERNMDSIEVHPSDAEKLVLGNIGDISKQTFSFDTETTSKLDKLIDSGSMFVANTGDAVRDKLVINGCKAYDQEQRQSLIEQHEAIGESLDCMMKDALSGNAVNGTAVSNVAGIYLTQLTQDSDNVLTISTEAGQDDELSSHCLQMSMLGMAIGIEMKLDERNVRNIGLAGLVHDWGMINVPEELRKAKRILTHSEYLEIKKHSIHSLEMLEKVSGIPNIIPLICYQVHERVNGTGYPRGRSGRQIHLFAKILHVADAYIALTSPRPYRKPLMAYAAMECMLKQARDKVVDADVVRSLLQIMSLFPIGSFVTLTDTSVARVLRRNGNNYTAPIVQLIQDGSGNQLDPNDESNIIDLSKHELNIAQALPTPGKDEISLTEDLLYVVRG